MSTQIASHFERRFDRVVIRSRWTGVMTVLGWTAFVICTCLSLMAGADYLFELDWDTRAWFLALLSTLGLIVAARQLSIVFRNNTRRSTAAAVEQRFEDLGQSVRTSVEVGTEAQSDQFSPGLLKALNNDVRQRTEELRLTEAIPTGPLKLGIGLLLAVVLLMTAACSTSWEWRTAARRVFATQVPYTEIRIEPGDVRVKQNESVRLIAGIAGRTRAETRLLTREPGESDWEIRPLTRNEQIDTASPELAFAVSVSNIRKPFEYRIVTGEYSSPTYTIDIQYPLAIDSFETKVEAPGYTQLEPRFVTAGNFDGVEGSTAHLCVRMNQPVDKAWLELRPLVTRLGEDAQTRTVPLSVNGRELSAELHLDRGLSYQVFATSTDGQELNRNRYRIRVHEDRPPRVAFETLKPSVRVNPLSELELKLSVKDDYGLKRAGIVFQFNNEPPLVLESVDFEDIVREDGTLTPRTKEIVRTFLELEYLEMTERDSLSYFGFAEDKRPGASNINETDLRFIDVLPFRREFVQVSGSRGLRGLGRNGNSNNAPALPQLGTLINKERFVLNRSIQMERSDRRGQRIDVASLDSAVNTQNKNSEDSGRLGDRLFDLEMRFGIEEDGRVSDLLYQSRDSMLLAADSLNNAEFEVATLQERDALGYLNEAREKIETQYRGRRFAAFRRAIAGMAGGMRNGQAQRQSQRRSELARLTQIVMRLREAAVRQKNVLADYQTVARMAREDGPDSATIRERIQKVQTRLLNDLRAVADAVETVESLSELARQRSLQAAASAEAIDDAVADGDLDNAYDMATRAVPAYQLLATNIEAVTSTDTSRRIGSARDLGVQLSEVLRGQARQAGAASKQADEDRSDRQNGDSDQPAPLVQVAELNTEIGRTVADILNSIVDPDAGIADSEDVVVRRLEHLINEDRLDETVTRLEPIADMIRSKEWPEVVVQTEDLADHLDIVSQRLDAMQREIMSPRIERLRQLARRTAEIHQSLMQLTTEDEIDRWHLSLGGLLNDIEESVTATRQVEELREAVAGDSEAPESSDTDEGWNWALNDEQSAFDPPDRYLAGLTDIRNEIERHIQELLVSGRQMTTEGAVPPKYKRFVGIFQQLLSDQTGQQTMKESAE